MEHHLPAILPDFSGAAVLVVGDVMLDRYWFGDTGRISPEAPVPIVKIKNTDDRPGGAGNVALNMAALGTKVTLLGVVGRDEAAEKLVEQLTAASVNHELCQVEQVATIIKLRVISRHQQLLRMDFEEKLTNPWSVKEDLLKRYQRLLLGAALVILSDYNKGTLEDTQLFIQLARQAAIPVLVDPKGSDFSIYQHADILTPNLKEFEAVVGACHSEDELITRGQKLLTQYHISALLVTRGEEGMTLIEKHAVTHLPAYARDVFDVTGAGDTVIGVLGASVAAGLTLLSATALANLAASIAISKLGAATVSTPELQGALTGKTSFTMGVMTEKKLLIAAKEARAQGKKIVFTNGCFDVLHAGHVTYLQLAKQLGDYLIVAVNADESIRQSKGPHRPINGLSHRMTVLAALNMVDWVVSFTDKTPERLLRLIQPDILVKGDDYTSDEVVGADIVRSFGGEVRVVGMKMSISSTAIIEKVRRVTEPDEAMSHD